MQKIKPVLNPKERVVLQLTMQGLTIDEIGERMSMPVPTVKYYSDKLRRKLEVSNRRQLAAAGRRYFG